MTLRLALPEGYELVESRAGVLAVHHAYRGRLAQAGFGPGSAKRHRELAELAGVAFVELALPSLALDLDEPEDLEAFLATSGGGRRTRGVLQQLRPGQ